MFTKYKKLILSQVAALMAVISLGLGWMRHEQTGTWSDQMAGSFLFFAILLFLAELKLIRDWLRTRNATPAPQ